MELLVISDNKIKISLTRSELEHYKISCDNIDYGTTETRKLLWSLLDDVKKQSGFDAAKSRIFVQLYPSRDGSCEMYVSRLEKKEELNCEGFFCETVKNTQKEYYIFDGINEVLAVCKKLYSCGYDGSSDAYVDEKGRFFLCTEGLPEKMSFMTEFGLHQSAESASLYIKEHCRAICIGKAVRTLGVL